MSGFGHTTTSNFATGNIVVDSLLASERWADAILYYSFPVSAGEYFDPSDTWGFSTFSANQRTAAIFALDANDGIAANDGFSLEGFTNLTVTLTGAANAHIRLANNAVAGTAYAYLPGLTGWSGDVWVGPSVRSPFAANYAWATTIHEIGHALGLLHPHESVLSAPLPMGQDSLEYSIMSYRSYVNGPTVGSYTNGPNGFPQTFMMNDIAALQAMYGADFTTNSGNTTYFWVPNFGGTYVNGAIAIQPGGNTIFATIWDGGGNDTYNLASYSTTVFVDLRPGNFSVFSGTQLANLGNGHYASGNIYNALQYNGDDRSLIENVYGGRALDYLIGNHANNVIVGFGGVDQIWGLDGDDIIVGGVGADVIRGSNGFDYAGYWSATSAVIIRLDLAAGGAAGTGSGYWSEAQGDILEDIEGVYGSNHADYLIGNGAANYLNGLGGRDIIYGLNGDDTLDGQAGGDWIWGNEGNDLLTGGAGADEFIFDSALDAVSNVDTITDFVAGVERLWLDDAVFTALGQGALAAQSFLASATGLAVTATQHILYNTTTGDLLYDADGNGGGSAVRFAQLTPGLAFGAVDVMVF